MERDFTVAQGQIVCCLVGYYVTPTQWPSDNETSTLCPFVTGSLKASHAACAGVSPLGAGLLSIWLPKLLAQTIGTISPWSEDLVLACRNGCGGRCYSSKFETPSSSLPK